MRKRNVINVDLKVIPSLPDLFSGRNTHFAVNGANMMWKLRCGNCGGAKIDGVETPNHFPNIPNYDCEEVRTNSDRLCSQEFENLS